MNVREADIKDKERWDSFVDSEGGDHYLYLDWKQFYEIRGNRFIPLMIESDSSQLLGILPLVREKKFLYSTLESLPEGGGGFLIRNDLSESEKHDVISSLVKYIDIHYSKDCASLIIRERMAYFDSRYGVPAAIWTECGFKYNYNETTGFPCTHIIELKKPFMEHHWNTWPGKLRQNINKAVKNEVTVIHDRELIYQNEFIVMLGENYKRHKNKRFIDDETNLRINLFKEKTKLFIALLNGQPIAGALCHYTPLTCYGVKVGSYTKDNSSAVKLCIKVAIEDACNAGYKYFDLGISTDENTAFYKGQFQPVRIPAGTYEKTYSVLSHRLYQASMLLDIFRKDKMYFWNNRGKLCKEIFGLVSKKK
jgi:hypothetical protein